MMAQAPPISTVSPRRFTADEYHAMAHAGILREDERVELIEGEVIRMAPIGSRHNAVVDRVNAFIGAVARDQVIVRSQGSVRLNERTEPEPDVALLRYRDDFYTDQTAGPADILLLVEVMQSSANYDRTVKLPLYAAHAIPEVWLIDLERDQFEVHRDPRGAQYQERALLKRGQHVPLPGVEGVTIAVEDLMGPVRD